MEKTMFWIIIGGYESPPIDDYIGLINAHLELAESAPYPTAI